MRLKCVNVGALGCAEFDLLTGLNAVIGPNGSGKSTLVSALFFALTGEPINGENLDSLISWGHTQCSVTLDMDQFSVTRTLSTTGTTKIKFISGNSTLTRKSEVESAICDIFGFVDMSILKLVFFAEQYRAIDFVEVTDSVRIQMLSALFGFAKLEKCRVELQKRASELKVDRVDAAVLTALQSSLESAINRRDSLVEQLTAFHKSRLSEDEYNVCVVVSDSPLVGYYDQINLAISDLTRELSEAGDKLNSLPSSLSAEDVAADLDKSRYEQLSKSVTDTQCKLTELMQSRGLSPAALREFLAKVTQTRTRTEFDREALEKRSQLLQSGKCPLTNGVPCPDLVALTDERQIADELADYDRTLAQLDADFNEMSSALTESENLERNIAVYQSQLSALTSELEKVSYAADFDRAAFAARKEQLADSEKVRENLQLMIASGNSKLSSLIAERDAKLELFPREVTPEEVSDAKQKLEAHSVSSSQIALLTPMVADAEKAVAEARESLSFAQEQNTLAEKNLGIRDVLEKVRHAFHRDNLPKLLVEDMLGTLNAVLDSYLSRFSFPYKVAWTSSGAILYTDDAGNTHRASQLSGGQKYVLVIALRCALIDLLQSDFPLFVLDEPTTGLDVANRESLGAVLANVVAANQNRILVVPTHDEMLLPTANIINVGD